MKVTSKPAIPEFTPIELTITLESADEARALFAVFNHIPVCDVLKRRHINPTSIRNAIGAQYYDGNLMDEFNR